MERIISGSQFCQLPRISNHRVVSIRRSTLQAHNSLKGAHALSLTSSRVAPVQAALKTNFPSKLIREMANGKSVPAAYGLATLWCFKTIITHVVGKILQKMLAPVQVGDLITIMDPPNNSITGTVQWIGLYSTTLVTVDGNEIIIPTKSLTESRLSLPNRKSHSIEMTFFIPVKYDKKFDKKARQLKIAVNKIWNVKKGSSGIIITGPDTTESNFQVTVSCLVESQSLEEESLLKKKIEKIVFRFFPKNK